MALISQVENKFQSHKIYTQWQQKYPWVDIWAIEFMKKLTWARVPCTAWTLSAPILSRRPYGILGPLVSVLSQTFFWKIPNSQNLDVALFPESLCWQIIIATWKKIRISLRNCCVAIANIFLSGIWLLFNQWVLRVWTDLNLEAGWGTVIFPFQGLTSDCCSPDILFLLLLLLT